MITVTITDVEPNQLREIAAIFGSIAAVAPVAPVAAEVFAQPTAPVAPGIDVDSVGLPWDGRIHAASRNKNSDGTWRLKRGVEPDTLTQVTGELKQTMAIAPLVPEPPIAPPAVPPAPPAAITPPPPTQLDGLATTASPISFPVFMKAVTGAFVAKQIDQAAITAACQAVGIPSLPMLTARPDLIGAMASALGIAL